MANDPWTGARLGANTDSPLGGSYLAELATELAPSVAPPFATQAARDTAFTAWLLGGGSDVDGLRCSVAGVPLIRRAGQWRGQQAIVYSGTPYAGAAVTGTFATLVTVTIPDPGYPYRLEVDARQDMLVSPGSTWNFTARVDSSSGELIRPVGLATSTTTVPVSIIGGVSATTYTGPHTVIFNAEKISGAPGDGYQPSTVANVQAYRVRVIPA